MADGGLFKFLLSTCGICTVLDLVSVPIDTALAPGEGPRIKQEEPRT